MRKVIRIFLFGVIFMNLLTVKAFTEELSYINNSLRELCISEEYSEKILNYIDELKITESDLNNIISDSVAVYNDFSEKSKDGISISELVNAYNDINEIAENLNLDIGINIINKEIEIKNKSTNEIIFKVNEKDANEYYDNFKELSMNEDEYNDLLNFAKKNIISDDNKCIENEENIASSYIHNEDRDDILKEADDLLNEIFNNSNLLIDSKEEDEDIATFTENDINVLLNRKIQGGVFIILVGCTLLSIILGFISKIN
ncbi:hypothetical protein [Clostridium celatum]|uniref:Uncharacterized protein n=1 Tax=Clostridium celatum DSM 1785 TaxID=545697 RepID=L1QNJ7_9CLOT|nr:hypothetical protein [Clostridium celatum]EKY29496.1 hypothetical protein HMPREF0216_00203 [Clostridium celatum DSM 1785]MCE9656217.1 hypothetical protein [Clostridium celatum]